MKATYWYCRHLQDSDVYSVRTRTKREAVAVVAKHREHYPDDYDPSDIRKVTVELSIATAPRDPKAAKTLFTTRKVLALPAGGKAAWKIDELTDPPIDANVSALYSYHLTATADDGTATFYLDSGVTYYRWAKKGGYSFTNTQELTVP